MLGSVPGLVVTHSERTNTRPRRGARQALGRPAGFPWPSPGSLARLLQTLLGAGPVFLGRPRLQFRPVVCVGLSPALPRGSLVCELCPWG